MVKVHKGDFSAYSAQYVRAVGTINEAVERLKREAEARGDKVEQTAHDEFVITQKHANSTQK